MTQNSVRLNAQSLTKKYGKVAALRSVSVDISEGGVIAVLGKNGAGKTTFIKCALGLERPTDGTISVFGCRAGSMAAKQRIGVMLQDSDLPDLLSARELVTLFASYYPNPLGIEETLTLSDTVSFANKRYKKLSGGQKRRVQFALAVIGNPDILFLDEPTTGLDADARKALWNVIQSFSQEGKTILLTTHYLEEADALADRVIVFASGKVVEDAPKEVVRTRLGGARIRCQTSLPLTMIRDFPACLSAEASDAFVEIKTSDAVATLRALLANDTGLSGLTVSRPSLEDIFEELAS